MAGWIKIKVQAARGLSLGGMQIREVGRKHFQGSFLFANVRNYILTACLSIEGYHMTV